NYFQFIWNRFYQLTEGGRTIRDKKEDYPYPTEPGIIFLSAWACTGEEKYLDAAVRTFEFAHEREDAGRLIFYYSPDPKQPGKKLPAFSRDPQARQVYNFYT